MEKIVSLCKRRGFIFQSSEIYGGINGFWDSGPLGAELKRNVKELWWNPMTRLREDVVGLDAAIIMAPQIWRASGHVDTFADPMSTCKQCKKLLRSDQVRELFSESEWVLIVHEAWKTGLKATSLDDQAFLRLLPVLRKKAPGLAFTKSPQAVLDRIKLHAERAGFYSWPQLPESIAGPTNPLDFNPLTDEELFLRHLATENLDLGLAYLPCPICGGELTAPRPFNLMLQTWVGPIQSDENVAYLRPETAQAIFAQFKNVHETSRQKIPFGIAQVGKAFRNEVTPRNFTFRSREFEQMELEFFIPPDEAVEAIAGSVAVVPEAGHPGEPQANWGWQAWHRYWVEERVRFYEGIGLTRDTLGFHVQTPEELAHYARATTDILYKFPFSRKDEAGNVAGDELEGIAARSDFDLSQHERSSGKPMGVFDEELRTAWAKLTPEKQAELRERYYQARLKYLTKSGVAGEKAAAEAAEDADGLARGQYIPHVIEPSAGADRLILALICQAYDEVTEPDAKGKAETRVILRFHPRVAPIKVAVLPLLKNRPDLVTKARGVFATLRGRMNAFYDDGGSIGRRYARQDEAGTPFCVTVDFDTLGEKPELLDTVTVRHRDDGRQERIALAELPAWLLARVG